ncbi:MAG: diguanylate cyclase [Dissulfurispiraceae bacterium]
MSEQIFFDWVQRYLSVEGHPPVSFEGLSAAEVAVARQIEAECRKSDTIKQYSTVFLQTLDSTERFSEVAIRALSALIKIGFLGETVRDTIVFCKHIAEIFTHELGFDHCSVLLIRASDGKLRLAASSAEKGKHQSSVKEKKKSRTIISADIALRVAGSGEHILIPDVARDYRYRKTVNGNGGIASLLSVPIKSGNDVLGVINCSHPLPEAFDENKINLILLLSNFAGQIITLINLHNRISAWNKALQDEVREKTSELQKKNLKLSRLAVTDSLTNLYNRRFFFTRLEEEFSRMLRYNEQFSLLSIDLDNLKRINDTYGHVAGDKVIQRIAKCLKSSVRKGDVIGRLGGDEFGYIMLNADEEVAYHFSLRLQESLAKVPFNITDKNPTMSIGIAAAKDHGFKKYQDIYMAADNALYAAKKKRNCVSVFGKTSKRCR